MGLGAGTTQDATADMSSLRGTCLHRQMFARARACVCVLRAGVKRKEMCVDVKNKEARKRTHTRTHVHLLKKKSAQAIHTCMHHTHTHTHTLSASLSHSSSVVATCGDRANKGENPRTSSPLPVQDGTQAWRKRRRRSIFVCIQGYRD